MILPSKPFLVQAGLLAAGAGLCALVSNALAGPSRHLGWTRPPAVALSAAPPPPSNAQNPPPAVDLQADPSQPARDISSSEAWALYQAQTPFLDARRHAEYMAGHVAGAWNISVWEDGTETRITEFEARVAPASSDPLVIYCSGGSCEDSHLLATKLMALGYRNLRLYQAGFPDWQQQGRPVTKGDRP